MNTGQPIALFGDSMAGKSRVISVQRRLNCYFENRPDGDKTQIACFGRPGLKPAFQLATANAVPARGMFGDQGHLYAAADDQFLQVNPANGSVLFTGHLATAHGHCELATNPSESQVILVDGAAGYLYAGGSFRQLSQPFPVGATTITYCSGFFLANQPGTQQFYQSNANDGSSWNGLQVASASAYSDLLLAVDNLLGNLVLFSEQHIELWQNVGNSPVAFQPILSAVSEYGLAAVASRAHIGSGINFLAQNREGQVQVCRGENFNVRVISTPDLDYIINQFATVSDAVALVFGTDAHKFYVLTFPSQDRSFQWDSATELWNDIQSGVSVLPERFNAQYSVYTGGTTFLSDPDTNQIYTADPLTFTDNGQPFAIEVVTRHVSSGFDRFWPSQLYLDMETGGGLQRSLYTGSMNSDFIINEIGYSAGIFGTMSGATADLNGNIITTLEDTQSFNSFTLAISSAVPLTIDYFNSISLVGGTVNKALLSSAATFSVSGNLNIWVWAGTLGLTRATTYAITITGIIQGLAGSDAKVMLEYSKDNGATWSGERWTSLGAIGAYLTRVLWRRFGCTRDATWRIRKTDPGKFVIAQASLKMRRRSAQRVSSQRRSAA